MRKLLLLLALIGSTAWADQRLYGNCAQGNTQVNTFGQLSTNVFIGSFPSCTVSVFNTGTNVLATIYGDNSRTPKSNPFTAASDGSWFFYLPSGGRVDIQMTNGTPALPTTVTLGDVLSNDVGTLLIPQLTGDLGGTVNSPTVVSAHFTGGTQNALAKFNASGSPVPSACSDNGTTITCTEPINLGTNALTAGAGTFSGAVTGASLAVTGAVTGASLALTGPVTAKNIGNVRYTDSFNGADWSAKLCAADADLGATPGVIYMTTPTQGNATTNCSLSSNHHIFIFPGTYTCTGCSITVAPVGTKIEGSGIGATTLAQGSVGTNLIIGSTLTDVEISGITFSGVSGAATGTNNFAIFLSNTLAGNISRVKVHDNVFTGWRGNSVYLQNAADVEVHHNLCFSTSSSCVRGSGVVRFKFTDNTVRDPSVTSFNIGIMIDSTDPISGTSYPVSTDGVISHNILINLPKWYSIELHSGQRIVVSNNQMNNVEDGVIVTPFNGTDTISDVVIVNNSVVGTNTQDTNCGGSANYGISVGGGGVGIAIPANISITGNEIFNANAALRSATQGGLNIGTVNNATLTGNIIKGGYGAGILIQGTTNPANVVDVLNNQTSGIQIATNTGGYCGDGATGAGLYALGPVAPVGKIDGNHFDNSTWGVRVDIASPNLLVSTSGNTFTGITTSYAGPTVGNVTFYGTQQFNTTTTCTTGNVAGNTCTTVAINLPAGYADTNYRLACTGLGPTNLPVISTVTKAATTFTITLETTTAAAASYTSFDCIVSHSGP